MKRETRREKSVRRAAELNLVYVAKQALRTFYDVVDAHARTSKTSPLFIKSKRDALRAKTKGLVAHDHVLTGRVKP